MATGAKATPRSPKTFSSSGGKNIKVFAGGTRPPKAKVAKASQGPKPTAGGVRVLGQEATRTRRNVKLPAA